MIEKIAEILSKIFFLDFAATVHFLSGIKFDPVGYYYFFSTVSQTFGAILGVVGLFAVFKLENIKSRLDHTLQKAAILLSQYSIWPAELDHVPNSDKHLALFEIKHTIDGVSQQLTELLKIQDQHKDPDKYSAFERSLGEIGNIRQVQDNVKKSFQRPAYYTALLIFLSLCCLPLGKFFSIHQILGTVVVILIIIGSSATLWLTVQSIKNWISLE